MLTYTSSSSKYFLYSDNYIQVESLHSMNGIVVVIFTAESVEYICRLALFCSCLIHKYHSSGLDLHYEYEGRTSISTWTNRDDYPTLTVVLYGYIHCLQLINSETLIDLPTSNKSLCNKYEYILGCKYL